MFERLNKPTICAVVSIDILDQSRKSAVQQVRDAEFLNRIINEKARDVAQFDHMLVEAGDGLGLVLFGAPEAALVIAMMMREAITQYNNARMDKLSVRTGISIGPIQAIKEANGVLSIQGEGFNWAEHVRNMAGANEIMVSRAYYDITSGLTDEIASMFVLHNSEHGVYAVRPPERSFAPDPAAELEDAAPLIADLMDSEKSPRHGLWASTALVAIVILLGGFLQFSKKPHPDLGVVIAGSESVTPATDLQNASASSLPARLASPETHEATPERMELSETPVEVAESVPTQEVITQPSAREPLAEKLLPSKSEPAPEPDIQLKSPAPTIAYNEEPEPDNEVVVRQEEVKKVATVTQARSGPSVEERRLPRGSHPKTIWDDFRKSFKQGRTERICTQAEIALNQCG